MIFFALIEDSERAIHEDKVNASSSVVTNVTAVP